MQKPTSGPVRRALNWVLVPLYYPEYRRLVVRSMVLSARLELLCTLFAVLRPFATPGLLLLLRRWFDALRRDVAEFSRLVRLRRAMLLAEAAAPAPISLPSSGEFRNPWV